MITRIVIVLILVVAISCNNNKPKEAENKKKEEPNREIAITAANLAGSFSTQSALKMDSEMVDSFFIAHRALVPFEKDVRKFYSNRDYAFAWYDSNGLIEQAGNLYNRLRNLQDEGLSPNVPGLEKLDSIMNDEEVNDKKYNASTELVLTSVYFYFANKVWTGLNENSTRKID